MITKDEIDQKAIEFGINTVNVEKDYVFGWVLNSIYKRSSLKDILILKGGNALRKVYLPDTRFSKDLDFSALEGIESTLLHDELNEVCNEINKETSIKFELDRTIVKQKDLPMPNVDALEARLYFKGFYGEETISLKTQLDVTQFDKVYLPVQERELIHPYSDNELCRAMIKAQKAEEILASKLNNLLHRQKVGDLFDLLYSILITQNFSVNRQEVITTFLKKSIFESSPNSARQQLLGVQLDLFRPFWDTIVVPIVSVFKFDVVTNNFEDLINALFNLLPIPSVAPAFVSPAESIGVDRGYRSDYSGYNPNCFDTNIRNTIIEAGRSRKMIEMSYDGYERLIEPYSMEYYVRRKDGVGSEYFWGFDTSGGKSGRQSIKRFFCHKIESAKATNYGFNPRYPVEF